MKQLTAALAILVLTACSGAAQSPGGAPQAKIPAPSDVVATVGSSSITLAQVDEKALRESAASFGTARLSQALYLARRAALDELIGNALMDQEAKTRGTDRATLVDNEIADKVQPPSEADVTQWYQANPARVQGATLDQVKAPIRSLLIQQRMADAREAYLASLRAKIPVKVALDPPREKVADEGFPSKGPAKAKVVVVEFSDFQCPFCQRAEPVVEQVLKTYGDRIRLVYRHYPLPNHPNARPAAEAAACAEQQGRFWQYHRVLFENPNRLSNDDLKAHAQTAGLDAAAFTSCLDNHQMKARVDKDIADANDVGVNGTPGFFINGRPLEGAQPFETFKQVIEEELNR